MSKLQYKDISKYKYELLDYYTVSLRARLKDKNPDCTGNNYATLDKEGLLYVEASYQWDGASGPAIDTKTVLRASLIHDALYQLIREGFLNRKYRKACDKVFYDICREDGMSWTRAQYLYRGLRWAGWGAV